MAKAKEVKAAAALPAGSPAEKLAVLEAKTIDQCIQKLANMIADQSCGLFFLECPLKHLQEQVKLAHQIRSLLE